MFASMLLAAMAAVGGDDPAGRDDLKAFPAPEPGMTRHVLRLPAEEDESALRVELVVGKTALLDGVNHYSYGGEIVEETIPGWGFPRYVVSRLGPMAGTLIGVDPDAPKVERFVTLGSEPHLIRYNSRLPVVVYVPEGAEVRYRLWRADPEARAIDEG